MIREQSFKTKQPKKLPPSLLPPLLPFYPIEKGFQAPVIGRQDRYSEPISEEKP
jgi:hypothetical protein